MVTLVRGGATEAREAVLGRGGLRLEGAPPGVAWGGLRLLLAALRVWHGDAAFLAALAPQADAVSLVLRRLPPQDPAAATRMRASEDGLLTHNPAIRRPLVQGLQAALLPLLQDQTLGIPDVRAMDLPSLGLLVDLALRPGSTTRLVLGAPAVAVPDHPLWRREPELLTEALALWALQATVEVQTLPDALPDPGPPRLSDGPWDPLDDQAEPSAWRLLERNAPLRPAEIALILAAGQAAFASHDPHAALRLGLVLLDRDPPLAALDRARLHRRVALAAYNRQVQSEGNDGLAAWLDEQLAAAWAGEDDPAARSHLAYRLCINRSRRRGDLEEGARWGREAIALAHGLAPGPAGWHRAWARNGLAYVLARQGRLAEAIAEMSAAWADAAGITAADAPGDELPWTRVVLADNLAELHARAADLEGASRWQRVLASLEAAHEGEPLLAFRREIQILRAQRRLVEAERSASAGLAAAERARDGGLADFYRVERADLRYRLGDATGAWADLEATLAARERADAPEDRVAARAAAALAASRAGQADRALELLDAALAEATTPAQEAELLAGQGLVCARAGAREPAEQLVNAAIEVAVGLGNRDVLLRVAVAAGEALLALERPTEATDAFQRALEIAATGAPAPPPADHYAALAGLLATAPTEALAQAALDLLPAALDDAETWLRLGPLAERAPEALARALAVA